MRLSSKQKEKPAAESSYGPENESVHGLFSRARGCRENRQLLFFHGIVVNAISFLDELEANLLMVTPVVFVIVDPSCITIAITILTNVAELTCGC